MPRASSSPFSQGISLYSIGIPLFWGSHLDGSLRAISDDAIRENPKTV